MMKDYMRLARQIAAESCVLLENENQALPLKKGEKIAIYGRSAFHYHKSGLGSGGHVNVSYEVGILDALKKEDTLCIDQPLQDIYEKWLLEHPYDPGEDEEKAPWNQEEMPVTEEMLIRAKVSDVSLIVIGRIAGEEKDNQNQEGSFLLTKTEEKLIEEVCKVSKRTVVLLNVGNIIDMSWVQKYHPQAVLYVWQGGQEGGNGVVDVLCGKVNPCGKLTDTIAKELEDYPSTAYFGNEEKNYYVEDIYVGYRYFETFARDKVLYPFGYGLSYTSFSIVANLKEITDTSCVISGVVKNIGDFAGKEVVQVYVEVPQGKLGNPVRKLVGFLKTKELEVGESEEFSMRIPKNVFASYDDSGITGKKSCFVLEDGEYQFYVGNNVRTAYLVGSYAQSFAVIEQLEEAVAPVEMFQRMKPVKEGKDLYNIGMENVPTGSYHNGNREDRETVFPFTGDKGYKLTDVYQKKISMDEFIAQLSDEDLIHISRGEGMSSEKVTSGTAAAFGGLTERLQSFGIPALCCADGPSGIRMDSGTKAFSLPNETALGCTFNVELVEELFHKLGAELVKNKIDSLLGPGMNIHRNPLNGRNFEYISEDPFVTGKIAAAQVRAISTQGVYATIKHFCANNQEAGRKKVNSIVSERALREIYLKGFEIAVKEGEAHSVMTTYGAVNGTWTSGSYDLCTQILRKEWGFTGIVMSDWWAEANYEGSLSSQKVKAPMVAAQNDIYMCVSDTTKNPENDDLEEKLEEGYITRGQFHRNVKNILEFAMKTPAFLRNVETKNV